MLIALDAIRQAMLSTDRATFREALAMVLLKELGEWQAGMLLSEAQTRVVVLAMGRK